MKLGIVAGSGALPGQLADHCLRQQIDFHLFGIEGQCTAKLDAPHCSRFRLGAIGTLVQMLKRQRVTDIVFIGGIKKPDLFALRPDLFLLRQLLTLGLFRYGDDNLLRRIADRFERLVQIRVRGIHEFMPELLAPAGVIGSLSPGQLAEAAIAHGIAGARAHGLADRGQAVIADAAGVRAYEGRDGTAAMLRGYRPNGTDAVLVKLVKPQQDVRLDLPTIGPATIQQAQAAGLAGIAVSAGKTLIVDREATVMAADNAGLFLIGIAA